MAGPPFFGSTILSLLCLIGFGAWIYGECSSAPVWSHGRYGDTGSDVNLLPRQGNQIWIEAVSFIRYTQKLIFLAGSGFFNKSIVYSAKIIRLLSK